MAAGILAAPGTEYGPCEGECQHRDCAETRRTATAECLHCGEPIGYDKRYYRVISVPGGGWDAYAHAACEEG